jgi:hypothetical protein
MPFFAQQAKECLEEALQGIIGIFVENNHVFQHQRKLRQAFLHGGLHHSGLDYLEANECKQWRSLVKFRGATAPPPQ